MSRRRSSPLHALVILLPLTLFAASPAFARDLYAEFTAGVSIAPDQDLAGGGLSGVVSLDPGFVTGAAIGSRIGGRFRVEANLSYRQAAVDEITAPGAVLEGAGDVGVFAAMANAYVDLLPGAPVIPYVGVGIGLGVVIVDSNANATVLVIDDAAAEFAWNVMAGASVPISEVLSLSLGYRYLATTNPELDATLSGAGSGTVEGEFDVHEVLFGARLNF